MPIFSIFFGLKTWLKIQIQAFLAENVKFSIFLYFQGIPSTRPFSMDDFLATLETNGGPSLTCGTKGDWQVVKQAFRLEFPFFTCKKKILKIQNFEIFQFFARKTVERLYRRFITCSNFGGWLSMRSRDVNAQLKTHYVEALCSADFCSQTLATKHNVEIVDLVLRIRERIIECPPDTEIRRNLVRQVVKILSNVDDDLKQLLMSNCSLREILA
nr:protein F58F6.7 [imported] - Caenorhabditis elegans [Caenorhabditis elegans]